MLQSYSTRITEVEEQLTFMDAQDAINANTFSRRLLKLIRIR
jgi:hypothetical protein